jgi:hypothetical protein
LRMPERNAEQAQIPWPKCSWQLPQTCSKQERSIPKLATGSQIWTASCNYGQATCTNKRGIARCCPKQCCCYVFPISWKCPAGRWENKKILSVGISNHKCEELYMCKSSCSRLVL